MPVTKTTIDPNVRTLNMARVLDAEAATQTAAHKSEAVASPSPRGGRMNIPGAAVSGSLAGVIACIKAHESGNYTEQSHLHDGSGAYQFIPRTWLYYFNLWRAEWNAAHPTQLVPFYALAYLAPPSVQDAVLMYALTHGGAGNWSEKYGADPCTSGLPGGG